jgi:hypothetical protein
MAKKKREIQKEKTRIPSKKHLVGILIVLTLIITLCSVVFFLFLQPSEVAFSLNAAIIDQLGESDPLLSNSTFVESVTNLLGGRNFTVTYYNKTLDVNFFKRLAEYNYGIIVLRVHSALREDNSTVDLFTSEKYASGKYQWERDHGLIVVGEYLNRSEEAPARYFAITSLFIDNLVGRFPKSIIIAMGCWSLKPGCEQMAKAFVDKGAKAYVGWTELVLPGDTDHETTKLLDAFLVKNKTLAAAIEITAPHTYSGDGKRITSRMDFYPHSPSVRDLRISDLIAEAKSSKTFTTFNNLELFSFVIANINLEPKDFLTD